MTIYFVSPAGPDVMSGGTRKLFDWCALLAANGFDARMALIFNEQPAFTTADLVVVPEVFGDFLNYGIPRGVRRVSAVQNSYLASRFGVADPVNAHPFMVTPDLAGIITESQHTEDRLREMFPNLPVPLIRTRSSGNGRHGQPAGFYFGSWPRERWVMHFDYKFAEMHERAFGGLGLPAGWEFKRLAGLTDFGIADTLRRGAIFTAANVEEGMCAPTSEAMISGCAIVCWPGGPTGQSEIGGPMEYLAGRAVIAEQDNIEDLRRKIVATAESIDLDPGKWAERGRASSEWFQAAYSREGEIAEIVGIIGQAARTMTVAGQ